jgi:nucleotide-binding universal stress UspA family protein
MTLPAGRTVVVGIDGGGDGQRALHYAIAEASRRQHALRLVHVRHETEQVPPLAPALSDVALDQVGREVLQQAERQARSWGYEAADLQTVLAHGTRTAAIMETLGGASCLVLGTRGAVMNRLLAGSTTTSVAAHAPVPVHCVPTAWVPTIAERSRIVVGVDGSDSTAGVLEVAFAEARVRSAQVEVVHAWRPTGRYDLAIGNRAVVEEWEAAAEEILTKRVESVVGPDPGVPWSLRLHFERPVVALYEAAFDADQLVVGRRSRWGRFDEGIGSVTRTLLRSALCPVVVVPVVGELREADPDPSA